jgi:peptidoglycan/xylan/chitin deacetylase (PgdA/CDA1 family)
MSGLRRSSAVRLFAGGLHHSGLLSPLTRAVGYVRRSAAFPILTYHRVNDDGDPFFSALPTAVFERQMRHVARNYRVLPLEDLVERLQRGGLPRNTLAITFDDGYRDNLTHAAPILSRLGLPATIFLATGFIGTAEVPWFDRLAHGLKKSTMDVVRTPWGDELALSGLPARMRAMERTLEHFKRVPDEERHRGLDELLTALGVTDQRIFKNLMLSWDDVHAVRGLGFTIGAHTVNHPILSRVTPQRAWTEILGSRTMIESACGAAPRAFAYPNGGTEDYTETVKRLVREAGFTCAVTTRFGLNTSNTNPWELRRGGPWEHHLPTFALKLAWYRLATRA